MASHLNELFEKAVKSEKIPGVAAIALDKSGKVLFKGTFGTTELGKQSAEPVTDETPIAIYSCTKLITTVALLQLFEQGKLKFDDPVEKYVPEIAKIQVLDGFDSNGEPKYRPQKGKATILNLLTHTAGFTYDFFDQGTLDWRLKVKDIPPAAYMNPGYVKAYKQPLCADPGVQYTYGVNIDWLGWVIEAISGLKLDKYCEKHIFVPLEMKHTAATTYDENKRFKIHLREPDGSLQANAEVKPAEDAETFGGGHFVFSTLNDYSTFLLTVLNGGTHPQSKVQILKKETVKEYLFKDQMKSIPGVDTSAVGLIAGTIPQLSRDGEFFPNVKKGWSLGLLLNEEQLPKGRSAGSGSWAGLANLYYWIDPVQGKLGLIMSAIFPFFDPEILHLYDAMEREVYGHEQASKPGEKGSSFAYVPWKLNAHL